MTPFLSLTPQVNLCCVDHLNRLPPWTTSPFFSHILRVPVTLHEHERKGGTRDDDVVTLNVNHKDHGCIRPRTSVYRKRQETDRNSARSNHPSSFWSLLVEFTSLLPPQLWIEWCPFFCSILLGFDYDSSLQPSFITKNRNTSLTVVLDETRSRRSQCTHGKLFVKRICWGETLETYWFFLINKCRPYFLETGTRNILTVPNLLQIDGHYR